MTIVVPYTGFSPAQTMLGIVQNACSMIGISIPTTVSGSNDQQLRQLLALLNEECQENSEKGWTILQREALFSTVAGESQGAISIIATDGFRYILNDTIWNRTQNRPLYGSLSEKDWQLNKSSNISGPFQEYRIRAGNLYFLPSPSANETCAFEYMSKNFAVDSIGNKKSYLDTDSDSVVLDEQIVTLGLVWRWKRTKGLVYQEDFMSYQIRITNALGRDAGKPVLSLSGSATDRVPGIIVPSGNWPL